MTRRAEVAATWESTGSLVPWAGNPRKNDGDPVERVAKSIQRFGFGAPIIARASDREIIAGHTRWKAAQRLGMDRVPVRFLDVDEDEAHALALADNRLTEITPWDDEALADVLRGLEEATVDLDGLGWTEEELDAVMRVERPRHEPSNDVPDVQDEVHSQPGEVYELGPHRLICGDSTKAETWAALMGDERWSMVMTSPPYAQQRDYGVAKSVVQHWEAMMVGVTDAAWEHAESDAQMLVNLGLVHEGCRVNEYWRPWLDAFDARGLRLFGWYVWDQGCGLPMTSKRGRLMPSHEFIFHVQQERKAAAQTVPKKAENIGARIKSGMRRKDGTVTGWSSPDASKAAVKVLDSVIRVKREMGDIRSDHPATFPVALPAALVPVWTGEGDIVAEPFAGSGTTLLACAATGRTARLIELDPKYCDVIRRRWTRYAREAGIDPGPGALEG